MFKGLTKQQKVAKARKLWTDARDSDSLFQREADEDFGFYDGTLQWTAIEKQILYEERRPAYTFNLMKGSVDLVLGMNEDIKVRYIATPTERTDGFLAEVLNDVAEHVEDKGNFEEEEDEAFESCTIAGRGYNAIDFVPNPNRIGHINIRLTNIIQSEVKIDPASRKKNLSDSMYISWDKWLNIADFQVRYPKFATDAEDILETGTISPIPLGPLDVQPPFEADVELDTELSDYGRPLNVNFYDRHKRMIRVVHIEYWEPYDRYYGFNPQSGQIEEFEKKHLKRLREIFGPKFEFVTIKDKKVKWIQVTGDRLLFDDDSPLTYPGFSISNCFAYRDVSGKTQNNFGVVRLIKDPQREVNKRWSQTTNLLNNQVQPGVYAEVGAFVDDQQAEQSMKEPGGVTYVQEGAIGSKKFQEKKVPTFPDAPLRLEEFAQAMIRRISGINPDLLGMDRGRQEPGVVVRLRQQQGMILLKPLFKASRQLKKANFEKMLSIIMEYMPDDQILSILGQNDRYQIVGDVIFDRDNPDLQANVRDVRNLKFDIKSEEIPGNRSSRMLELAVYLEMQTGGFPVDPRVVIDKLDLPQSEKNAWMQYIAQQAEMAKLEKERAFQLEMAKITGKAELDNKRIDSDTAVKVGKLNASIEKDQGNLSIAEKRLIIDERGDTLDFIADMAKVNQNGNGRPAAQAQ